MAFNLNDAADVEALRVELTTDPAGQGYADAMSTGATVKLVNLLRAPSASSEQRVGMEFTGDDLLIATTTAQAEYQTVVTDHAQSASRSMLVQRVVNFADELVPERFHTPILDVFDTTNAPTIRQALITSATGTLRREEAVFGEGTSIDRRGVQAAIAQ